MRGVIIAIPIGIVLWLLIVVGVWAATNESTDDGTGSDVVRCESECGAVDQDGQLVGRCEEDQPCWNPCTMGNKRGTLNGVSC